MYKIMKELLCFCAEDWRIWREKWYINRAFSAILIRRLAENQSCIWRNFNPSYGYSGLTIYILQIRRPP